MEVELQPIREEGSPSSAKEEAGSKSAQEAQSLADEQQDIDSAKDASTYSWLPQMEEQPLNDNKPFEIAGPPQPKREAPQNGILLTSVDEFLLDWVWTVLIGIFVVSFWRGGWVLFDVISCDQPETAGMLNGDSFCFLGSIGTVHSVRHRTAVEALVAGYLLLGVGLTLLNLGLWRPTKLFVKDAPNQLFFYKSATRVVIVLFLGEGTLCLWRGIWYLFDYYVHPEDATISAGLTTGFGCLLCMLLCSAASLLAPPAIFLMDGPAHLPPPIGVTIITSYRSISQPASVARERNSKDPIWLIVADMALSYVVLPIGVVGFWRGMWALLDTWLWGFTNSQKDINFSILWSFLLGVTMLLVGSEDAVQHFSPEGFLSSTAAIELTNRIFGRLRTLILAFGTVNFWRAVWLVWDEFLGNSHIWSCILSHLLGIGGLLVLGCLSCITAPPSTLGVDAIAHPESSDEPLFHNVPVPAEALHYFSIAQRPEAILKRLQLPEPLKDPNAAVWSSREARVSDSTNDLGMTPQALIAIDSLLVQEEHVFAAALTSLRTFTSIQSSANIQTAARSESSSVLRLTERHMAKREKSQFFRSR